MDFIYRLYEIESNKTFYIGRTIEPYRRLLEHKCGMRNYEEGDELKYQYASTLDELKLEWDMEVIQECGDDTKHFEDYYINKYRMAGEPIMNMKAGDDGPWMGREYSNPESFVAMRTALKNRPKYSSKGKTVREVLNYFYDERKEIRSRFVDDINKEQPESEGLKAIRARLKK